MDENNHTLENSQVPEAISELINRLLDEGVSPAEISFHLTASALDLGIQLAPSSYDALSVVTSALTHISRFHSKRDKEANGPDKSGLEKTDNNSILLQRDPKSGSIH